MYSTSSVSSVTAFSLVWICLNLVSSSHLTSHSALTSVTWQTQESSLTQNSPLIHWIHTHTQKYRPGLHRGAGRRSGGAYRRCYSCPAGGCLCPDSGPIRTRWLGAAADPCPGSAGPATDWTGRPASPGSKRCGTLHLHTEGGTANGQ